MTKYMKAVRLVAPRELELCELPVPKPAADEVVCRVRAVSICGTDPHIINGEYPGFWPKEYPLVLGHEWSGDICALGEAAEGLGWRNGDVVCGISHVGCGQCAMCLAGRYNLCLNYGRTELGHRQYGHYVAGAYAEYICVSVKSIARVPEGMSAEVASGMDPLSIALHMTIRSEMMPGDTVFINGSGSQGLMSILTARSMGADRIIVSGSGYRLKTAESMGAVTVDYRRDNVAERVRELTKGIGAGRVLECTGTQRGMRQAVEACAKGGVISVISLPSEDIPLPIRRIVLDEIKIVGNRANPNTLSRAISIGVKYKTELERMITHRFSLEDYAEALEVFTSRRDNSLRVLFKPNK